jgi:tetratricopeptide (TPR) repeat protein
MMTAAGKIGMTQTSRLVLDKMKKRGWSNRLAKSALEKIDPPRPRRALKKWIRRAETLDLLMLPDRPGANVVSDLDEALAGARTWRYVIPRLFWREYDSDTRNRLAEAILIEVYRRVLTEHNANWALLISSERAQGALHEIESVSHETLKTVTALKQETGSRADEAFESRLNQLPPLVRESLRDSRTSDENNAWFITQKLTAADSSPREVLNAWSSSEPSQIANASARIFIAIGNVAEVFSLPEYAARCLLRAYIIDPSELTALARSAFIDEQNAIHREMPLARQRLGEISAAPGTIASTVKHYLEGQFNEAFADARQIESSSEMDSAVAAGLRFTSAMLSEGDKPSEGWFTRGIEMLNAELSEVWTPGLEIKRSELLSLRAGHSESLSPDLDYERAMSGALRARDFARSYRLNSSRAAAEACKATIHSGNYVLGLQIALTPPRGDATAAEANSSAVRAQVALAGLMIRDAALVSESIEYVEEGFEQASLKAKLAMMRGEDSTEAWAQALEVASDEQERVQALAGLAQTGSTDLPDLELIEGNHPEVARQIRASSLIARGEYDEAIARLRPFAASSPQAAHLLASAYEQKGDNDSATRTYRDAADDFHDLSLRIAASLVLSRATRQQEALAEIEEVLAIAPDGWGSRMEAYRIGAQLAMNLNKFARAADLLRAAARLEPKDNRIFWALLRALAHDRNEDDATEVFYSYETPPEPGNGHEAIMWLTLASRRMSKERVVSQGLSFIHTFGRSEELMAQVLTLSYGPSRDNEDLSDDLAARVRDETEVFFSLWPESKLLRKMSFQDMDELLAQLTSSVRLKPEQMALRQQVMRKTAQGRLPLSTIAAVAGRSYAEIILCRGSGTINSTVARSVEESIDLRDLTQSVSKDVVIDTSSAAVLGFLTDEVRTRSIGVFRRITVSDESIRDAMLCADSLGGESTGSIGYDPASDSISVSEISPEEAAQLSQDAHNLLSLIRSFRRERRPTTHHLPEMQAEAFAPWVACIDIAKEHSRAFWCDDVALRAVAREMGVQTFSTFSLLSYLQSTDALSPLEYSDAVVCLLKNLVGDATTDPELLLALLAEDPSNAPAVYAVIRRRSFWSRHERQYGDFAKLAKGASSLSTDMFPPMMYASVAGLALSTESAEHAAAHAGCLLAVSVLSCNLSSFLFAQAVAAASRAIEDWKDPSWPNLGKSVLALSARLMVSQLRQQMPVHVAAQYVMSIASELEESDRLAVSREVLSLS